MPQPEFIARLRLNCNLLQLTLGGDGTFLCARAGIDLHVATHAGRLGGTLPLSKETVMRAVLAVLAVLVFAPIGRAELIPVTQMTGVVEYKILDRCAANPRSRWQDRYISLFYWRR
jgi:hypothetical protein